LSIWYLPFSWKSSAEEVTVAEDGTSVSSLHNQDVNSSTPSITYNVIHIYKILTLTVQSLCVLEGRAGISYIESKKWQQLMATEGMTEVVLQRYPLPKKHS
jgi:hypothetical protein